ncbi:MAG: immunity protein 19 [Lachnospiraceae bacterium]|nr:immunity protein 19 [Lachnospiraceae bacterium]
MKQVIAADELTANAHFVRWFLMTSFPEGVDSAEGSTLYALIEEKCTLDTEFIDHLTGYYEGVFEENDGYVDAPKMVVISLATGDELSVAFHPGDTIYSMNGSEIGCTGPHYEIRKLSLTEFLAYTAHMQDREKLFLLPMVKISVDEQEDMTQIIQSILCSFHLQEYSVEKMCACILENCLE